MPVAALWRLSRRLHLLEPAVSLGVKHTQHAVVLLTVIPSEDVEFLLEQSGRVVFDLRRRLRTVNVLHVFVLGAAGLLAMLQVVEELAEAAALVRLSSLHVFAFFHERPLEATAQVFALGGRDRAVVVIRRVGVALVGLAVALFVRSLVEIR